MTNTSFTELQRTLLELLNEAELRKGKYAEGMSFRFIHWSFSSLHRRCPSALESKTKWQSGE